MNYLEDLFLLEGKVAIVTGAARGIGKAIAEALLRARASVVMVDTLEAEVIEAAEGFKSDDLAAFPFVCDVTDGARLQQLVDFVMTTCGRIDVLVNNAGVTFPNDTLNYPDEAWDRTYRVGLKGPFALSCAVGRIMKEQGTGSIINITSINAERAFPNNPAYVAVKGGLKQLTKALALDLGRYGVRANNIGPGYIRTKMTENTYEASETRKERADRTILGRWGRPEDVAGLVILLASEASSYITGQDFYVDGGWLAKGL